jgi:hypothetical protein
MCQIEVLSDREYRIFGLQRSGNNAVIDWIMNSTRSANNFLKATNCSFVNHNTIFIPLDRGTGKIQSFQSEFNLLAANSWHIFDSNGNPCFRMSAKRDVMVGESDDDEWITNNEDPRWDEHVKSRFEEKSPELLIQYVNSLKTRSYKGLTHSLPQELAGVFYHVEDFPIDLRADIPFSHGPILTNSEVVNIFVIRDFGNWVSSRIKSNRNVDAVAINLWKKFADLYINQPESLDSIFIIYNLLKDEKYRRRIANILGLTDGNLSQKVSVAGGGSSFDSHVSLETTGDRHNQLIGENQVKYQAVIHQYRELLELSNDLFEI